MNTTPTGILLRPEVLRMAEAMELQLRKHDADRGDSWKEAETGHLLLDMAEHTTAFVRRALGIDEGDILAAGADIANYAWMIAEVRS